MSFYGGPYWWYQNKGASIKKKWVEAPDPIQTIKDQQQALDQYEKSLGIGQIGDVQTWTSTTVSIPETYAVDQDANWYGEINKTGMMTFDEIEQALGFDPLEPPPKPKATKFAMPVKEKEPEIVDAPAGEQGRFGRVVDLD